MAFPVCGAKIEWGLGETTGSDLLCVPGFGKFDSAQGMVWEGVERMVRNWVLWWVHLESELVENLAASC